MNVSVDESCIGCGACESMCNSVFHVDEKAEVKCDSISGNEDCVKAAADACPVYAIKVDE